MAYRNPYFASYLQGASSLGTAVSSINQPYQNQFMPDQTSGWQGMGAGASAGSTFGPMGAAIGAGLGAITGAVSSVIGSHKQLNNLDTSVNGASYDAYGRPVYQGGEIANAMSTINDLDKTAKWDSTNILGIGRKAKRKRAALQRNIQSAQQQFNESDRSYREQMNQRSEYLDRMNPYNRMYNVIRYQNG
jgi:hypothetical protein